MYERNVAYMITMRDSEGANVFSELSTTGYGRTPCPADAMLPPNFLSSSLVARRVVNDATSVASVIPLNHHVASKYQ